MRVLSRKIDKLNRDFGKSSPLEILNSSINLLYKDAIVYVCSFGSESAIILHMISKIDKNFPIILINTKFLFDETMDYKKELTDKLQLKNCTEIFPDLTDIRSNDKNNNLWKSDTNKCCHLRKVLPLQKELAKYKAWISGRKAYHEGERKKLKVFEFLNDKMVVNPLANMTQNDVSKYFNDYKLPRHPLFSKGFLSIGCRQCTVVASSNNDVRSGRWINSTKTECGIHLRNEKV